MKLLMITYSDLPQVYKIQTTNLFFYKSFLVLDFYFKLGYIKVITALQGYYPAGLEHPAEAAILEIDKSENEKGRGFGGQELYFRVAQS